MGVEPNLALSYSSQGSVYGGIADHWSLQVPDIRLDTSESILKMTYFGGLTGQQPLWTRQRWVSTLSGGRPLVPVTEPAGVASDVLQAYRAQNDDSYIRYERIDGQPYGWRARALNGMTYYFGETTLVTEPAANVVPLTSTEDRYGNRIEYQWVAQQLVEVRYTSNPSAGLAAFAKIQFDYVDEVCSPSSRVAIGAAENGALGVVEGRRKLTKIRAIALDGGGAVQHTREYALTYDAAAASCTALHGPQRVLTSIQESAWQAGQPHVDLPPVTFTYNRLERAFDDTRTQDVPWSTDAGLSRYNTSSGVSAGIKEWNGVQTMMLDFDGDGLPDRLERYVDAAQPNECKFVWHKNLGRPGGIGDVQFDAGSAPITLPRLPWKNEETGGPRESGEECFLNHQSTLVRSGVLNEGCDVYQRTHLAYRWLDMNSDGRVDLVAAIHRDWHFDPNELIDPLTGQPYHPNLFTKLQLPMTQWPLCLTPMPDGGACSRMETSCLQASMDCTKTPCTVPDDDVAQCQSQARVPCGALQKGLRDSCPTSPGCEGNDMGSFTPGAPACGLVEPHERCDRYPWFIYSNTGGQFAAGALKFQPVPLESDGGDSPWGGGGAVFSRTHSIVDIDGDGHTDIVARGADFSPAHDSPNWWVVFRGDGTGGFSGHESGDPYVWLVPDGAPMLSSCVRSNSLLDTCNGAPTPPNLYDRDVRGRSAFTDLNGDGLPDLAWHFEVEGSPGVMATHGFYNNGRQLGNNAATTASGAALGGFDLVSRAYVHPFQWDEVAKFMESGERYTLDRLVDLDGDGRVDLLRTAQGAYTVTPPQLVEAFMNDGGTFHGPVALPTFGAGGNWVRAAIEQHSTTASGAIWEVDSDFMDLDGDGLAEGWRFVPDAGGSVKARVITEKDNQPLRLLRAVSNGRGAVVNIMYAASTDPATVTQDASFTSPNLRKAMPNVQWVVKSISTTDQWDPDVSTTSYTYTHPIWGKDDRGRWGFRGFEEVTTTLPPASSGSAKVVDTYDYAVDWSGRLSTSRRYSAEEPSNPRTISQTTWSPYALFGGAITTYHAYDQQSWTCNNAQSESACRAANTGYVRKLSIWEALSGQAWAETNTYTMDSPAYGAGDRRTYQGFTLYSTPTAYQLQQHSAAAFLSTNGNTMQDTWTSYSETYFDAAYKQPTSQSQFFDFNSGTNYPDYTTRAVTSWTYDPATGVKLTTRNPRNFPTGPVETYGYDGTKRFVTSTTNELGQIVTAGYEPGTGALLWKQGPNGTAPNIEKTWTDVDGLGRPLASYVNRDPGSGSWVKTQVTRTTYTDAIVSGARTKVLAESLIDYGGTRWTWEQTQLDGEGRPDIVTVRTGGAIDAVTTYDYDGAGRMVSVTLPDPSQNTSATVTYTYDYDSLGRATSMRRPAVGGATASGIDLAYDGLTQQSDEVVGSLGGPSARKVLVNDNFGRLVEVREYTGASTYASTFYQYDGGDRITRIQNPDNVVTQLIHDLGGRRTRIDRAGRTWTYVYRTDGQLQSETVPGVAGTTTNTFAYDPLGRMSSRTVGTRGLSTPDQTLLGIGATTFAYDGCANGIGRLCTVTLPGDVVITAYAYDAEGNTTDTTRTLKFGGLTSGWSRTTKASYGPGGKVVGQDYADQANGQTSVTKATYAYDDRGNPSALSWTPATGIAARPVATQTRNVAGLVTLRQAALLNFAGTTGSWKKFNTAFTYDALTRVASQTVTNVNSSGITTQHAKQQLDYYGADDPARLRHWMGAAAYDFTFGYDQLHELTTVGEASGKYSATFAYGVLNGSTPSGSGKFRSANVGGTPQSGSLVVARNVTYDYTGSVDPEAPSGLVNVSGGTRLRSYAYDAAGNQTEVHAGAIANPPTPTDRFVYDGDDQLRRATKYTAGTTTVTGIEEYFYDHSGQRVGVVTRNAQGAVTKLRAFLGDTEVEISAAGAVTQAYAYLSLGTPVAKIVSPSGGWTSAQASTTWANSPSSLELQYHGLSSNTLLSVRPDGAVQAGFVYAPYGDVVQTTGATSTTIAGQRRRFNDKFRDDLTSLTYYGVRYYDGLALTWTQSDPMYRFIPDGAWKEPRKAALYQFVMGNPTRYIDPDGRSLLGDVVGAAVTVGLVIVAPEVTIPALVIAGAAGQAAKYSVEGKKVNKDTLFGIAAAGATNAVAGKAMSAGAALLSRKLAEHAAVKSMIAADGAAAASPSTGIQANAAKGAAWNAKVGAQVAATNEVAAAEVTVKTASGTKTRLDWIARKTAGDPAVSITEAKSSATAPLTPNQKTCFPEIETSGAVVVGKGKPGFPGGTVIPPTKVDIVRPPD